MVPKVIDITGPISGDTNMAAVIFGALFSTKPKAAKELQTLISITMIRIVGASKIAHRHLLHLLSEKRTLSFY